MRSLTFGLVLLAVGLLASTAAAISIPARATYGAQVSGDEPYYLLTAASLAEDGSLDLADELAEEAYQPYHEVRISQQTEDLGDGRRVSPHDPLLPAVLALPMLAGGWVAAKAALAVLAGMLAALTVWTAVRRFGVSVGVAGAVVAACSVGVPLAPYGAQVYPELPAALVALLGVVAVTSPRVVAWRATLAAAATVVVLPWLSVKYVPVAAALALGLLWARRRRGAPIGWVVGGLGAAGVLYLIGHQVWYGGWTVYATGDHFADAGEFSVVGTGIDVPGRSRRLTGLLLDRDFGLLAWAPVWLLVPPALGALVRRRPSGWLLLVATATVGWANATFVALTMHGWWFPGRQIVVVVPMLVLALTVFVERSRRWLPAVAVAGAVGAATWGQLVWEAGTDRRTLIVDFSETAAPWHRVARALLPDGMRATPTDDLLLAGWSVVLVALGWWGWRTARRRAGEAPTAVLADDVREARERVAT